ncbi:MAG: Fe-Mn family superoxide dismutase [Myxococcales bacterium]
MKTLNRREVLSAVAIGVPTLALAGAVETRASAAPKDGKTSAAASASSAFAGKHQPVPLPFAPGKLTGISEKMIVSHHDNNYAGAIKNLNKVEEQLAAVNKDTPGFLVSGLKERELTFTNSMILHEQYFGNLGGSGKASGPIQQKLAASYGSFGKWEEHFRALGLSLGGGSGWAIVDYNIHDGDVRAYWSGGHTQTLAAGLPLLVMDMYEHAYTIDYGSAAAKYIDAFFQNINWDTVNGRLEAAEKASSLLRP